MIFNSLEYFFFLPFIFALYWVLLKKKLFYQNIFILAASYFFYGLWSWRFLTLLFASTVLDYLYGFGVNSASVRRAKFFLWLSLLNNLGILLIFKYFDFFAAELQLFLSKLGVFVSLPILNLALPIGISFYTFHGMSYVFDVYRKKLSPVRNIIDYSVFVSFFPLLVAGPIERASHLLPQIQSPRTFNYVQAVSGVKLIVWGLFKKIVIADNLAPIVNYAFENTEQTNGVTLIVGAIAFSFQIYGDFSGYSDIALGSAKLLGFELLSNFKFPYFSRNIAEFWRRWHVSLSTWFRDYLYLPMGGSRTNKVQTVRNVFVVFLVSGFWHGASWNFIAWGLIHASLFLLLSGVKNNKDEIIANTRGLPNFREVAQMLSTFFAVTMAWVFFRAENIQHAIVYVKKIFISIYNHPGQLIILPGGSESFLYIIPLIFYDWYMRRDERNLRIGGWSILFFTLFVLYFFNKKLSEPSTFIYFQF